MRPDTLAVVVVAVVALILAAVIGDAAADMLNSLELPAGQP